MNYYFFLIIVVVHFAIASLSCIFYVPPKGKSFSEVQQKKHYADVFNKNFPFLCSYAHLFYFIPFIYYFIYFDISKIDYDLDSRNILPIIYGVVFSGGKDSTALIHLVR